MPFSCNFEMVRAPQTEYGIDMAVRLSLGSPQCFRKAEDDGGVAALSTLGFRFLRGPSLSRRAVQKLIHSVGICINWRGCLCIHFKLPSGPAIPTSSRFQVPSFCINKHLANINLYGTLFYCSSCTPDFPLSSLCCVGGFLQKSNTTCLNCLV